MTGSDDGGVETVRAGLAETASAGPGEHSRWAVLGIVTLAHVASSYCVLGLAALAPFIKADLRLDHLQIGLMTTLIYMGTFFLSVPAGSLVDRLGEYKVLLVGQVVMGIFMLGLTAPRTFVQMIPFLVMAGIGYAGVNPATAKAIVERFPSRGRGLAMSIKQIGVPIGGAIAAASLPGIALVFGWRSAMATAGAVCLVSAVAIRTSYAKYAGRRLAGDGPIAPKQGWWSSVRGTFRNRDLILLSTAIVFFQGFQLCLITYFILYAKEVLAYPILTAGALFSLANLSGMAGRICCGAVSDFMLGGARRPVLIASGMISAVLCLAFTSLTPRHPPWVVWAVTLLLGFTSMGWPGIFFTLAGELSGAGKAGSAFGLCVAVVSLGVFIEPPLFGYVVDKTGSYSAAWIVAAALLFGAALLIIFVREPGRTGSGKNTMDEHIAFEVPK